MSTLAHIIGARVKSLLQLTFRICSRMSRETFPLIQSMHFIGRVSCYHFYTDMYWGLKLAGCLDKTSNLEPDHDATRCRRCEPFRQHRRQAQDLPLPAWALFQLWYSHRLGTPPAASDFSAPALTWHIIRAGAGIRICSSVRRRRENSNLAEGGVCGHTPPLLARLAKSKVGLGSVPAARPPHGCLCL